MRFGNVARYREEVVTGITVAGLRSPAPPPTMQRLNEVSECSH